MEKIHAGLRIFGTQQTFSPLHRRNRRRRFFDCGVRFFGSFLILRIVLDHHDGKKYLLL